MIIPRASPLCFNPGPFVDVPLNVGLNPEGPFNWLGPYFLKSWIGPFGPTSLKLKLDPFGLIPSEIKAYPTSSYSNPRSFLQHHLASIFFPTQFGSGYDSKGHLLEILPLTSSRSQFEPAKNSYTFHFFSFFLYRTLSTGLSHSSSRCWSSFC